MDSKDYMDTDNTGSHKDMASDIPLADNGGDDGDAALHLDCDGDDGDAALHYGYDDEAALHLPM